MKKSIFTLFISLISFSAFATLSQELGQQKVNELIQLVDSLEYDEARKVDAMYVMNEQNPRNGSSVLLEVDEASTLISAYINDDLNIVYVFDGVYEKEFWPEEMYDDEQPGSYYFKCQGEIHYTPHSTQLSLLWGKTRTGESKERCHPIM